MAYRKLIVELLLLALIDASVIGRSDETWRSEIEENEGNLTNVFNGVYTECFLHMSYTCVQNRTLLYLKELNKLAEVSVIGDYVKFVKLNTTEYDTPPEETKGNHSEDLAFLIDSAVDKFFTNHVMKFSAMGRDISVPNSVEGFVGRKKRKGGGGGGGHGGGGGGHDDGGKKKMMMMAMMCMKMKLMMMVPAMMGMMGMMSFKGMMFSMMSFMISKMMLLMKLLEKKGAGGGSTGGGGGGDAAWQAGGGGGGAWMPAGGDYGGGGGGGGGYDANGQWQSRSIYEKELEMLQKPVISYVKPTTRLSNKNKLISRKRRGIIDVIQNAYEYWINRILGSTLSRRKLKQPNYKIVNGVKYVYYPIKMLQKVKTPKEVQVKNPDEFKPIVIAEDFNKGEIVEGPIESRMNRKKFSKIKDTMNETMDENPWE